MLDVDLTAQFLLAREIGRAMLARGSGKIIFTASLLSFQGGVNVAAYTAAKSGLAGLTRALANEWAGRGVNVNAIVPGYIATDNNKALRADRDRYDAILGRIPAGRWGLRRTWPGPPSSWPAARRTTCTGHCSPSTEGGSADEHTDDSRLTDRSSGPTCAGRFRTGGPRPSWASSSTGAPTRSRPGPSRAAPWARWPSRTGSGTTRTPSGTATRSGSPAAQRPSTTGTVHGDAPYDDFLDAWTADRFDPTAWAELFAAAGAGYVIPTTKHHDGIALWDAPGTGTRNTVHRGPRRDLVREIADAVRAVGSAVRGLLLRRAGLVDQPLPAAPDVRRGARPAAASTRPTTRTRCCTSGT